MRKSCRRPHDTFEIWLSQNRLKYHVTYKFLWFFLRLLNRICDALYCSRTLMAGGLRSRVLRVGGIWGTSSKERGIPCQQTRGIVLIVCPLSLCLPLLLQLHSVSIKFGTCDLLIFSLWVVMDIRCVYKWINYWIQYCVLVVSSMAILLHGNRFFSAFRWKCSNSIHFYFIFLKVIREFCLSIL